MAQPIVLPEDDPSGPYSEARVLMARICGELEIYRAAAIETPLAEAMVDEILARIDLGIARLSETLRD